MKEFVIKMVKKHGIGKTVRFLTNAEFSDKELVELENCKFFRMGIPNLSAIIAESTNL